MKNSNRKHGDSVMTPSGPGTIVDWDFYFTKDHASGIRTAEHVKKYMEKVSNKTDYLVSLGLSNGPSWDYAGPGGYLLSPQTFGDLPWIKYPSAMVTDLTRECTEEDGWDASKNIRFFLSEDKSDYIDLGSLNDIKSHVCESSDCCQMELCSEKDNWYYNPNIKREEITASYVVLDGKKARYLCPDCYESLKGEGIVKHNLIVDTYGFWSY